ncbi:MAG: hypothetical protein ACYSXF_08565, partial [Planctomycetota bacterium]
LWAVREAQIQRANPMLVSTARWLAIEKLEDIVADRHSPSRGFAYVKVGGNYPAETPVAGFAGFDRSVTVSAEHGSWDGAAWTAGTGYVTVTVDVDWTDSGGTPRTLSIATVITDYSST